MGFDSPPGTRIIMKTKFKHGDLTRIAKLAGVSVSFVSDIINGRKEANPVTADKLAVAAKGMGYKTTNWDWMFPRSTQNELFRRKKK